MAKNAGFEVVATIVGRWNTDIQAGWEVGLRGKERVGTLCVSRRPPEHLSGQRATDWLIGRDAGEHYAKSVAKRTVRCYGEGTHGLIVRIFKGWCVSRTRTVARMEKAGCRGDVVFSYYEGERLVRTHVCGI